MQPNLQQDAKFGPDNAAEILQHYLALSRTPQALAELAALLPPGTTLVTGAARMDDPSEGETYGAFFNSIQVVRDDGAIVSSYDKVHLVPFGEYVPHFLDALIRAAGLREFVNIPGGFEAGDRRRPLAVPG